MGTERRREIERDTERERERGAERERERGAEQERERERESSGAIMVYSLKFSRLASRPIDSAQ